VIRDINDCSMAPVTVNDGTIPVFTLVVVEVLVSWFDARTLTVASDGAPAAGAGVLTLQASLQLLQQAHWSLAWGRRELQRQQLSRASRSTCHSCPPVAPCHHNHQHDHQLLQQQQQPLDRPDQQQQPPDTPDQAWIQLAALCHPHATTTHESRYHHVARAVAAYLATPTQVPAGGSHHLRQQQALPGTCQSLLERLLGLVGALLLLQHRQQLLAAAAAAGRRVQHELLLPHINWLMGAQPGQSGMEYSTTQQPPSSNHLYVVKRKWQHPAAA
jgi:hypothetical protein